MNEPERQDVSMPGWLPFVVIGLLVLPFHPLWIDFEQVRRGLLLLLGGAALLASARLPHVRGERLALWFVLALVASAGVQALLQWTLHDETTIRSFQPWAAAYRIGHWFALVMVMRLGAASEAVGRGALPLAIVLLATSAFGLLQRLGLAEIMGYGVEREPVSTLGNLNVASEWTAIAATAVAVLAPTLTTSWRRWVPPAALVLAGAYVVVNQSRSGMVALPIGLSLLWLLRRRERGYLPLVLVVGGAAVGLLLSIAIARPAPVDHRAMRQKLERSTVTLAIRLEIAKGASQLFAESPVYGHGPGQFAVQYPRVRSQAEIEASSFGRQFPTEVRNAHDDWLELLVDGGLTGLVLFAAMLLALQRGARDKTRLVPLFVLLLLMLVRSPIGNAPAAAVAFWLAGTRLERGPPTQSPAFSRFAATALRVVLGLVLLALGLLPVAGNCAFVPYMQARRTAQNPPITAVQAAAWWMPYEPRWLEIEARENLNAGNVLRARHRAARAVRLRPFAPQLVLLLAEALARSAQFGEAIAVARQGLAHDPMNPELHVLASTAYAQLGDVERAIESVVVDPHPVLRAELENHFADLAVLAEQKREEKATARYLAEHHFVATVDRLGSQEPAVLEAVTEHIGQLAKSLSLAERLQQDSRWLVAGALHALDLGNERLAIDYGATADRQGSRLLGWQRAMLGSQLDRLAEIESWRPYLSRR